MLFRSTPSGVKKCACDSYYAVDTEFKDTWTKYKSYDEIVNEVDILLSKYPNNYKIDIVITGGEPLLYWNKEEFQKLLKHYIENGHKVTIETNASLNLNFEFNYQKNMDSSFAIASAFIVSSCFRIFSSERRLFNESCSFATLFNSS